MKTNPSESAKARKKAQEFDRLIERATARPGIAEIMALSESYRARLAEIDRSLGRIGRVSLTTTDSTA